MKRLLFAATAVALVAVTSFAPGMLRSAAASQTAQTAPAYTPHYEWQYHYGGSGRHPRWQAGWVLVK
jgi:Spy/CpxP family protein refolding chaperone